MQCKRRYSLLVQYKQCSPVHMQRTTLNPVQVPAALGAGAHAGSHDMQRRRILVGKGRLQSLCNLPMDACIMRAGRPEDSGISLQIVQQLGPQIPVFGVCMGHQCIGQIFGGNITRAPGGVMHGKTSLVYHNNTSLMKVCQATLLLSAQISGF